MADEWDFSEIRRLQSDLGAIPDRTRRLAAQAIRRTAAEVEQRAKTATPVRTGNLRNSIGTTVTDNADDLQAEIGPTADYGGYVEWGTRRMAPRPYLGPATDAATPGFLSALEQIAKGALND